MQITQIKNAMTYTPGGSFMPLDVAMENGRFARITPAEDDKAHITSLADDGGLPNIEENPDAGQKLSDSEEKPYISSDGTLDANGKYLIPGLIDIHFHGCAGHDFCDGTREAMDRMAEYQLRNGITTICPASMTLAEETLIDICRNAAAYASDWTPDHRARLRGINLEGPFLSLEKKGAQNPAYLESPSGGMLKRLIEASNGLVKLITVAPELPGAMEFIKAYGDQIRISLGHTACDYETAKKAFKAGACHMTHLFNAMLGLTHRAPGPIGAAFDQQDVMAELICDGIHIHPSAVRMAFQLFGKDRMILISDSMMATGLTDGTYSLGGLPVTVKGHFATLADGTLAGSATNLFDCMKTAASMGIPLETAVGCATINPARAIGIDGDYGSIEEGKVADCLILNDDLSLHSILLEGRIVSF